MKKHWWSGECSALNVCTNTFVQTTIERTITFTELSQNVRIRALYSFLRCLDRNRIHPLTPYDELTRHQKNTSHRFKTRIARRFERKDRVSRHLFTLVSAKVIWWVSFAVKELGKETQLFEWKKQYLINLADLISNEDVRRFEGKGFDMILRDSSLSQYESLC